MSRSRIRGYGTCSGVSFYAGGVRIGLARVSTRDQHPEAQQDALRVAGCEQVFTDTASGVLARRPGLDQALLVARRGDPLVVTRLHPAGTVVGESDRVVRAA